MSYISDIYISLNSSYLSFLLHKNIKTIACLDKVYKQIAGEKLNLLRIVLRFYIFHNDATWFLQPSETSRIREGDETDKANSGYFAPPPRYVEAPTMPRQRQTPCYSSPYRGSKGRRRRVDECVGEWRAGQSSSVLPAPGAPSHISPGIYEPRYDREIARMAE